MSSYHVICILQTQISKEHVENLAGTLGYDNVYAVGSTCRSGEIGVCWNNGINMQVLGYSRYHVDFQLIRSIGTHGDSYVSMPKLKLKIDRRLWDVLKSIAANSDVSCLCIRYFIKEIYRPMNMRVLDT